MSKFSLLYTLIFVSILAWNQAAGLNIGNFIDALRSLPPAVSSSTLVKRAGYIPQVFNVPTQPGYRINVVRIINPTIKWPTREPVLLIHGILLNANGYLALGAIGGRPHDWTAYDPSNETMTPDLYRLVGNDKASRSIAFLLSNFGYDVWCMNRRPTLVSKRASTGMPPGGDSTSEGGSSSAPLIEIPDIGYAIVDDVRLNYLKPILDDYFKFNENHTQDNYYGFSFDEQALYDVPILIDFILAQTGQPQLDIIGHSAGGLLTSMVLSQRPDISKKVRHTCLWAPAVNLHYTNLKNPIFILVEGYEVELSKRVGPFDLLPFLSIGLLFNLIDCVYESITRSTCGNILDPFIGLGTAQLSPELYMFLTSVLSPSSNQEILQLIQSGQRNQISHYDYRDPLRNAKAYGDLDVPKYNLSNIQMDSMSVWQANTDRLVNQFDTRTYLRDIRTPYEFHFLGNRSKGIFFNHLGFLFHSEVTQILNIPTLIQLARAPPAQ